MGRSYLLGDHWALLVLTDALPVPGLAVKANQQRGLSPEQPKLWPDRQTLKEACSWQLTAIHPPAPAGEGGPRSPAMGPEEPMCSVTTAHM